MAALAQAPVAPAIVIRIMPRTTRGLSGWAVPGGEEVMRRQASVRVRRQRRSFRFLMGAWIYQEFLRARPAETGA